jgi:hypothetical protein
VRVIQGNASLLQGCASNPNMYYEVSQASQLNSVFELIAQKLATCGYRNKERRARSGRSWTPSMING